MREREKMQDKGRKRRGKRGNAGKETTWKGRKLRKREEMRESETVQGKIGNVGKKEMRQRDEMRGKRKCSKGKMRENAARIESTDGN